MTLFVLLTTVVALSINTLPCKGDFSGNPSSPNFITATAAIERQFNLTQILPAQRLTPESAIPERYTAQVKELRQFMDTHPTLAVDFGCWLRGSSAYFRDLLRQGWITEPVVFNIASTPEVKRLLALPEVRVYAPPRHDIHAIQAENARLHGRILQGLKASGASHTSIPYQFVTVYLEDISKKQENLGKSIKANAAKAPAQSMAKKNQTMEKLSPGQALGKFRVEHYSIAVDFGIALVLFNAYWEAMYRDGLIERPIRFGRKGESFPMLDHFLALPEVKAYSIPLALKDIQAECDKTHKKIMKGLKEGKLKKASIPYQFIVTYLNEMKHMRLDVRVKLKESSKRTK